MTKEEILKLTKTELRIEYQKMKGENVVCYGCSDCYGCSYCYGCSHCSDCSHMILNVQFTKAEYDSWILKNS